MKDHQNVSMIFSQHQQLQSLKMDTQKMGEGSAMCPHTMEGKAALEPGMFY